MFKEIFMTHSTEIGLVLFFVSFLAITLYAVTRSRKELESWSSLPLGEGLGHPAAVAEGEAPNVGRKAESTIAE